MRGWRKKHVGNYIIQMNEIPVFSKDDIKLALGLIAEAVVYDKHLKTILHLHPTSTIQVDQLRHIVRILYEMDHGDALTDEDDLTDVEIVDVLKQGTKFIGKGSQYNWH